MPGTQNDALRDCLALQVLSALADKHSTIVPRHLLDGIHYYPFVQQSPEANVLARVHRGCSKSSPAQSHFSIRVHCQAMHMPVATVAFPVRYCAHSDQAIC